MKLYKLYDAAVRVAAVAKATKARVDIHNSDTRRIANLRALAHAEKAGAKLRVAEHNGLYSIILKQDKSLEFVIMTDLKGQVTNFTNAEFVRDFVKGIEAKTTILNREWKFSSAAEVERRTGNKLYYLK